MDGVQERWEISETHRPSSLGLEIAVGGYCPTLDLANLLGRGASHHGLGRHRFEHQGAGSNHGTFPNGDVAQHSGSSSDQNVVLHLWVPVPVVLASSCTPGGSDQRHRMENSPPDCGPHNHRRPSNHIPKGAILICGAQSKEVGTLISG